MFAYSTSKPTIRVRCRRDKPLTMPVGRRAVVPRNAVTSAEAVGRNEERRRANGSAHGMTQRQIRRIASSIARFQHPIAGGGAIVSRGPFAIHSFRGLPPVGRPGTAARVGSRVRRSRDAPARHGVGRGAAFPDGSAAEAGGTRADGDPVCRGVRRRGRCRRSTTASASRSSRACVRRSPCRWPLTTGCARRISRCSAPTRRRRKYLPRLVRGEVLGAWGLTEAGAGSDAAGMKTTARARRRWLGDQRGQELHHPRAHRRRDGRRLR